MHIFVYCGPYMKNWQLFFLYIFSYFGFKQISYQIVSLFDMYMDMGERIARKQDRPSLIIEDPPQGPLSSPKYIYI